MDAYIGNTLVARDESGIDRLTVIDNEECLTQYKLGELWWSNRKEADEDFTSEMVKYVTQLNVCKDICFIKKAGWEVPSLIVLHFRVVTQFLKLAVELQLKLKDIGLLATGRYKKYPSLNLLDMVNASDRKNGDDAFVKSVRTKMEEGLKEFVQKVYKHRVG
ncbi:hypothetical protein ISN44_As08g030350 [Arabidopsis suecica]|uniref:1-phosphatidylinositol 4-kinase n=1 Tax=Arabidopsis suecica TaxID=45249 RepID=A0A8T2B896_ARASU|nr:hypothetical protein ISN44_As08g030350 [Arabidopsis suecica]